MSKPEETVILEYDRYVVRRDKYNWILYEKTDVEEVIGYYTSLDSALVDMSNDILSRKLKLNIDKSIKGILIALDEHNDMIRKEFGEHGIRG
jgi:hypothetical protein